MTSNKTDSENPAPAHPPAWPPYLARRRAPQGLSAHRQEFAGQGVALDGDHLLSQGQSARDGDEAATKVGINRPRIGQGEPDL
jgi:hypothetical protein